MIGVVGASGGLGASSLAVAVAARAARRLGATACVDGDPGTGGLDVTACLEHLPGLRWPDLVGARGAMDGAALLRALPAEGALRVLAGRGLDPGAAVVQASIDALRELCAVVVVDLGRDTALAGRCTEVVVVGGVSARHLADCSVTVPRVIDSGTTGRLVLRAGRRDAVLAEEVAAHLDLPLVAVLGDEPHLGADADRGRMPGARPSSKLTRVADRLLLEPDDSDLAAVS